MLWRKTKRGAVGRDAHASKQRLRGMGYLAGATFCPRQLVSVHAEKPPDGLGGIIFGPRAPTLVDGGIVVVGGGHAPSAPSCQMGASEKHIVVESRRPAQDRHQSDGLEVACVRVMVFAQSAGHQREPAALQLCDEAGRMGLCPTQVCHAVGTTWRFGQSHIVVVAVENLRQFGVLAVAALAGETREDRNVETIAAHRSVEFFQKALLALATVGIVFILNLNHDDSLVVLGLPGKLFVGQRLADPVKPVSTPLDMGGIGAPQPQSLDMGGPELGQPARIGTAGELGTDEGTRTDDGVEAKLVVGHLQPPLQVGEIEMGGVGQAMGHGALVPIPRHIGLYGVETGLLDLLETLAPQCFRASEIVESRTVNEDILALYRQARPVIADTVGMSRRLWGVGSRCRSMGEHAET